jgi:hypothetical protein
VIETSGDSLRERLYERTHPSTHGAETAKLSPSSTAVTSSIYRCDIQPTLPSPAEGPVFDIGCGQGRLAKLMLADRLAAEQEIRTSQLRREGTFAA